MIDPQAFADARVAKNLSQTKLAKLAGCSQQHISQLENGTIRTTKKLFILAKILGVQPEVLDKDATLAAESDLLVPVVGFVGAGWEAHFYEDGHSPEEYVPMPDSGTEDTVAVRIKGSSLGYFENWLVYYDQVQQPPTEQLLHKICVVTLADGRVLIKKLLPGSRPGRYNLLAANGDFLMDAQVKWAAEVRQMNQH
jgi:transcriptional regulator with XRE-family HTH domain